MGASCSNISLLFFSDFFEDVSWFKNLIYYLHHFYLLGGGVGFVWF
jgi:hypothetical protein